MPGAGIFAKSIQNAATFGGRWGILGGVGYAGWYLSFFAAALVGYVLRTRAGFQSLPTAIERCYGPLATLGFGLALMYRLWNEIWSNSVVVASFYGPVHSPMWWAAAMVSTAIPAVYVLMGGMRSSLVSDVLQAGLGLLFLFVILGLIGERMPGARAPRAARRAARAGGARQPVARTLTPPLPSPSAARRGGGARGAQAASTPSGRGRRRAAGRRAWAP